MRLIRTPIAGVVVVELDRLEDDRGFFARTYCRDDFLAAGIDLPVAQTSIAWNAAAGTVRGLHWSAPPHREAKLVRVTSGAVLDVLVDVRTGSSTALQSVTVELSAENRTAVVVPPEVAHGYQTLTDGAELSYAMSVPHEPGHERGLRYDDPALALSWPLPVTVISEKDTRWPLLG
jgi:dTDP-4-dehydrorhamnose 3,5-epimerase